HGDDMQAFDWKLSRRTALLGSAGAALQLCWPLARAADQVLHALVGFPPGGAIDTTARVYAEALKGTGMMLVDNRPGAAGNIAGTALAQSKPDGATLMFAPVNVYCISPALYK